MLGILAVCISFAILTAEIYDQWNDLHERSSQTLHSTFPKRPRSTRVLFITKSMIVCEIVVIPVFWYTSDATINVQSTSSMKHLSCTKPQLDRGPYQFQPWQLYRIIPMSSNFLFRQVLAMVHRDDVVECIARTKSNVLINEYWYGTRIDCSCA